MCFYQKDAITQPHVKPIGHCENSKSDSFRYSWVSTFKNIIFKFRNEVLTRWFFSWIQRGDRCYAGVTTMVTFNQAYRECSIRKSTLLSINSEDEFDFLLRKAQNIYKVPKNTGSNSNFALSGYQIIFIYNKISYWLSYILNGKVLGISQNFSVLK